MENAADALKMAGAALLFILAFSIAMSMFTRARQTTDAVLANMKLEEFLPKVEALENNVTREVGIETVIPTLYTYAQNDNIRIRITYMDDTNEIEHQVFDQTLELDVIKAVQDHSGSNPYYERLKNEYNNSTLNAYLNQAPWASQDDSTYRMDRINAYIYGTKMKHMQNISYEGSAPGRKQRGLLNWIRQEEASGRKVVFEESYLEYNIDGTVEKDEYGEDIVTRPPSTKIVITYKLIKK